MFGLEARATRTREDAVGMLACLAVREQVVLTETALRVLTPRDFSSSKAKGAFVSESALHSFDGDKPNSVGVIAILGIVPLPRRQPICLHRASPNAGPSPERATRLV